MMDIYRILKQLPHRYPFVLVDRITELEKGKFTTQAIQSQFGWHVIFLEDVRNVQFPPYEQVKPQIQNVLQEQEVQKVFADLRAKAKIE